MLVIYAHHHKEVRKWNFLYKLESQADELIVERMRRTIADALSGYKPMCEECDVAIVRHHSYERTLITEYGKMRLDVPVFHCGAMTSGMDVIGKSQARKRYSKKIRDETMRLAAQGVGYERVGKMLGFWGSLKVRCASG